MPARTVLDATFVEGLLRDADDHFGGPELEVRAADLAHTVVQQGRRIAAQDQRCLEAFTLVQQRWSAIAADYVHSDGCTTSTAGGGCGCGRADLLATFAELARVLGTDL